MFQVVVSVCYAQIVNIEGSPALARALSLDPTLEDGSRAINRSEAIRCYEEYLKEYPQSPNKPLVLAQIGLIYLYAIDDEHGVNRDIASANKYLDKAIASGPGLLSPLMISARTNRVCGFDAGIPRMRARMKLYEWFVSLSDADLEASIKKTNAIRKGVGTPEQVSPGAEAGDPSGIASDRELAKLRKRLDTATRNLGLDLVYDGLGTEQPEVSLSEVIERLGEYPVAQFANEKLEELRHRREEKLAQGHTPR